MDDECMFGVDSTQNDKKSVDTRSEYNKFTSKDSNQLNRSFFLQQPI